MKADDKGSASDVLNSIFGVSRQGLSLFSNNAFRRQTSVNSEGDQKGSQRVPEDQSASASVRVSGRVPVRVPEGKHDGACRSKNKEKIRQSPAQGPSKPSSSLQELVQQENRIGPHDAREELVQQENRIGSHDAVSGKKEKLGRGSGKNIFSADTAFEKLQKRLHSSQETIPKKKLRQQQECVELATVPQRPTKRKKTAIEDGSTHTSADNTQSEDGLKKTKAGTKRKKEESLEARYEKKLRGLDDRGEESIPTSAEDRNEQSKVDTTFHSKKRKRVEGEDNVIETASLRTFDADERLKRTIFLGNLPLTVKKKAIIKEFSTYGPIESVRLRSVPLLDTKLPRKGAIITGQINQAIDSQHAYVVFKALSDANAALAHNMKEFSGNHVRVDAAYAPQRAGEGKVSLHYDHRRSLFVGNIPFDVKDEELYQAFGVGKSPELDMEAVRVVRDPQTSLSKGIAYVLFKTKAGASFFLSPKHKVKLRDRVLRISRVLASQTNQMRPNPSPKHARNWEEINNSQLQRKRTKRSASYEGVRARKEPGKEKHKGMSRHGGHQHVNGSVKGRTKGPTNNAGTNRKRVEKKQRGISRSKKIRRT